MYIQSFTSNDLKSVFVLHMSTSRIHLCSFCFCCTAFAAGAPSVFSEVEGWFMRRLLARQKFEQGRLARAEGFERFEIHLTEALIFYIEKYIHGKACFWLQVFGYYRENT